MDGFKNVAAYKCIYAFTIEDAAHHGLIKVGDATVETSLSIDKLPPNSHDLNAAARKRIDSYTQTAGISYRLLHTELAVRRVVKGGATVLESFRDHNVHDVLENSGIHRKAVGDTTGREWYEVDLGTVKEAIAAFKEGAANMSGRKVEGAVPIVFRPEQREAIEKTVKQFKKSDWMLWNAKMRFGKTLSALEVVKRMGFTKTIIMTHRPVVDEGWYDDFRKIFTDGKSVYGSKGTGYTLEKLLALGRPFVYFASIQDLRGSTGVGGKFEKNSEVFDTVWDCVIVDEAHEGTQTVLGDSVVNAVVKRGRGTKCLMLSGTPFNILEDFEDNEVYTWDYVMEQESKAEWDKTHFGDSNPYEDLPELRIFTYDLGTALRSAEYVAVDDKAFNFHEFFRTWTGDATRDHAQMPTGVKVGDFVHASDVRSFLGLMTREDPDSLYPFSNAEYRELFKHTLWIVPGVAAGRALQRMMLENPVFGCGQFDIVNVAGEGDEERGDALGAVRSAIAEAGDDGYTITISCGRLTTGVTVPEWTAVFMLAGSFSTSAAQYLQTIFRVQSPYRGRDGRAKERAYVFDFAPDRTLKMVAKAVAVSSKAGKTRESDKVILGRFLNFCPVIGIAGSRMVEYDTPRLLQQLKRAYAERVADNGFEDPHLYNEELLRLDDVDLEEFEKLKKTVGENNATKKVKDVTVNDQGLTDEEYEQLGKIEKKPKRELAPEEKEILDRLKKAKDNRRKAIAILTQVSVRMPLLIFGAEVDYEEDITLSRFVEMVDDRSWEEFMPKGVTKKVFRRFERYYDEDVFVAAGRRIRNIARHADTLPVTERVKRIAGLFATFRNPDKETVLTPWRVVNMHMASTLGGWDFFDEGHREALDAPRFVDRGEVTETVFGPNGRHVLEINSKTGLYPLYVAYGMFRGEVGIEYDSMSAQDQKAAWDSVVRDRVFVVCKTPMAKTITRRTLMGYTGGKVNAHYFDNLVNALENKSKQFVAKVSKPAYWSMGGKDMEFSAIVGNPPYQKDDGGYQSSASPVYQEFVDAAIAMAPDYVSMITPARWYSGGKGLDDFRARMIHDRRLRKLVDFPKLYEPFPNVKIRGGISFFLWDRDHEGPCEVETIMDGKVVGKPVERYLAGYDIVIRRNEAVPILDKVTAKHEPTLAARVSARKPFGLATNFKGGKESPKGIQDPVQLYANQSIKWVDRSEIPANCEWIDDWKVLVTRVQGTSSAIETRFLSNPIIAGPGTACTETYLVAGRFDTENEAQSFVTYLRTRLVRFLISLRKVTQDSAREVYSLVPDLTYDHEWSDAELYERYGLNDDEIAFIESTVAPLD